EQPGDPTAGEPLDHLTDDFVQHLAERGAAYHFDTHEFTDLLLYTPSKHRPAFHADTYRPVAVAYDGSPRHHQASVRSRTRTIPAQLERLGWQNETLWAIDVFTDPIGITDSVADKLRLDARSSSVQGFETQSASYDSADDDPEA
ncbi:MAG: hypothetical protein ACTH1B_10340, partial [Yaniella sp.]|uniref:hypothetical protein n=1 Tax=Yaniella sp. TaxID=2773929 RepID=UPI003F97E98D